MLANEVANLLNSQVTQTPPRNYSNEMNKEAFLLLLTQQLANQDPLNPMNSEDFTAQLAQFSSLEQQMNLNDSFVEFLSFQQLTQASTLIDKEIISLVPTDDGVLPVTGTVDQVLMIDGTVYLHLDDGSEIELSTVVSVEPNGGGDS